MNGTNVTALARAEYVAALFDDAGNLLLTCVFPSQYPAKTWAKTMIGTYYKGEMVATWTVRVKR
jgi:hypothetical protein